MVKYFYKRNKNKIIKEKIRRKEYKLNMKNMRKYRKH